jgi:hypothetical protein
VLGDYCRDFRTSETAHCGGGPKVIFVGKKPRTTASLGLEASAIMDLVEELTMPESSPGTSYRDWSIELTTLEWISRRLIARDVGEMYSESCSTQKAGNVS